MFHRIRIPVFTILVSMLALTACGGKAVVTNTPTRPQPTAPTQTAALPTTSLPLTQETYAPVVEPANFVAGVDNPYFPLKPGTTFIYDGVTEKGHEHVEVVVTSDTKVIMGVTCIAVSDTVTVDGKLEEGTVDWYAQDKQGNVWYFGEDTQEYKDGKVSSTHGAWLAGVDGALPGIIMKANPTVGETYRQEYYKGEAEDWATVLSVSESVTVPTGSYSEVLMTNEWAGLDNPPVYEHKYYANGVGNILTKGVEGGWELILVEIRHD